MTRDTIKFHFDEWTTANGEPTLVRESGTAWIQVTRKGGPRPHSRRLNTFGPAGGQKKFGIHNNDVSTTLRGIIERIFLHKESIGGVEELLPPHTPSRRTVRECLAPFTRGFAKHVFTLTPWTHDQFVESYRGQKKTLYANAAASLQTRAVEKKDSYLSTFVKAEKLNLTNKPDPVPRVIQPRTPRYNVMLGCYIRPLESIIYKILSKMFGSTTVFKGLNASQQGELMAEKAAMFTDPVFIGFDLKRMDQHTSEEMLSYEHSVYKMFYSLDRLLRRLLSWQLSATGFAYCKDGKIKYSCKGRRCSGDMNTALGNVLLCSAMTYSYFEGKCRYALCNNGDDNVLMLERADMHHVDGIAAFFSQLGFPMELEEPVYELRKVEFCQTFPVYDGETWVMTRDPRVCLSKDLATVKHLDDRRSYDLLRKSVGECGLALAGNLPIFHSFYRALVRGAGTRVDKDTTETGFRMLARGMTRRNGPVSEDARFSFYVSFGITPEEQMALESYYDSVEFAWISPVKVDQFGRPAHVI